ncbi:translation factor SUA5 [Roseovarius nanhaiticus]|uniref:Threonylcarbamoyl-AMP synthase n=1 Tax=Roseovarius nanhaiticus TaxID=573024 RepID=A0A1N7HJZ0_9RHOB|nr:L-threonylcarbamoyladenylate synthase [Roseovarius nanhaiticus]SEL24545.1 translation factor SUA5 [Roseovarius nanhaiticus]SIS25205.1 translation factor SUA5 [Roseovarius nanhaiticus]
MQTRNLMTDRAGIEAAAALITDEQLVALPTETVYGLAGDARSGIAVARIFEAKGRPSFNPLIVHVPDTDVARRYAVWSDAADRLAAAFWPGPLTLVLPLKEECGLSPLVTAGQDSVALRVPAHAAAQALLRASGAPLAAPSANPSGRISPTHADHVRLGLDGRIAAILDGGSCGVGVESTIIGLTGAPTLLRPGGLPAEIIEAALGGSLAIPEPGGAITAPGQLSSHYAPAVPVRLEAETIEEGELLLGFAGTPGAALDLSASGDLVEAAANLFAHLHALDARGAKAIAVAPVPDTGLGRAINDRLRRAAAPR